MNKDAKFAVWVFAVFMSMAFFRAAVCAADLPIDITAIDRQSRQGHTVITTRIGANLFSADSLRVNEVFEERIRVRQGAAAQLFLSVAAHHGSEPQERIKARADELALFSRPVNFNNFSMSQDSLALPPWLVALILAVCALGGFLWAWLSGAKKARKQRMGGHVH